MGGNHFEHSPLFGFQVLMSVSFGGAKLADFFRGTKVQGLSCEVYLRLMVNSEKYPRKALRKIHQSMQGTIVSGPQEP